jgi:hypothetical protein
MMNFLRPKGKRVVAGMRRQLSRTCEPSPATAMLLRPLTAVPGSRKAASVLRVSCDAMEYWMQCVTRGSRWSENSTPASAKAAKCGWVWRWLTGGLGPCKAALSLVRTCLWNRLGQWPASQSDPQNSQEHTPLPPAWDGPACPHPMEGQWTPRPFVTLGSTVPNTGIGRGQQSEAENSLPRSPLADGFPHWPA